MPAEELLFLSRHRLINKCECGVFSFAPISSAAPVGHGFEGAENFPDFFMGPAVLLGIVEGYLLLAGSGAFFVYAETTLPRYFRSITHHGGRKRIAAQRVEGNVTCCRSCRGGVILAPCPPPGLCPAGFLATGDRRRVCAVEHTPMAGPAGVALAGPVVGAGVLCFRARKTFFHKTSPFFFLG